MVPVPVPTFEKVTVPVPVTVPAPYLDHEKQIFKKKVGIFFEKEGPNWLPYIASLHYINTPKLALLHP